MKTSVSRPPRRQVRRLRPRGRSEGWRRRAVLPRVAWVSIYRHPATRALLCLVAAGVAVASLLAPDGWLQGALGLSAPLVPLWLGWAGLSSLPRLRRPRPGRQFWAGAALLSAALPPLLSLADSGGFLGATMLLGLEALLGQGGAIFVLLLAASGAPLLMLGHRRERLFVWLLELCLRQAGEPPAPRPAPSRANASPGGEAAGDSRPQGNGASADSEPELVILGPGGEARARGQRPPGAERPPAPEPERAEGRTSERAEMPETGRLEERQQGWQVPSLDLLNASKPPAVSPADLKAQARTIEQTLETFRLPARVVEVRQGPTVSEFGVEPAPGVAVDRIAARANDLALRLGARSIRIQVPIPGRSLMGVEVPHGETTVVALRETLEQASSREQPALPVALGKDVSGQAVVVDLARLPHLLIAGATGSGKSVGLNTLLASLLLARTPDEVQLILIDPKRVELTSYTGIPHLRMPVLTDVELVVGALRWALAELESRFSRFASATCRNLEAYNQRVAGSGRGRPGSGEKMARLVIVIDELADLMMTVPDEAERHLCRLAQLGRAAGIHLVVATQRPSVDVLTGLIKANFPARISFAVSSLVDSRVVLDAAGAEQLLGRGDMLFLPPDAAKPRRIQGAYVDERELRQVVSFWRRQGSPRFRSEEAEQLAELGRQALADPEEDLLERARELAAEHDNVSASFLQRRLGIGYPKAARLMQRLEDE